MVRSGPPNASARTGVRLGVEKCLLTYGLLIDANDLWIAATALAFEMPVVTRNERHFARVPGLDVIGYG